MRTSANVVACSSRFLKVRFATNPFLYIGYSNRDQNWKLLQSELQREFFPSTPPTSYRIAPHPDTLESEILAAQGITTIEADLERFSTAAKEALGSLGGGGVQLAGIETDIPSELQEAFERHPAAIARLLKSWTLVNSAPFTEAPNTAAFLQGEFPNWGLAGSRLPFERDLEDQILDELLDYATASGAPRRLMALLAPAGYGVSTLLMTLAGRVVQERAGPIFMHRRGTPVLEGDIAFAASLFSESPFFIVDNAADVAEALVSAVFRIKDTDRPVLLLVGERLNEWREKRVAVRSREYVLESLSDAEMERLLDFLAAEHALGRLEELDRRLQLAALRERSEKQLLVAMREVTEGRGFDAIIEDEYRGMPSDLARRVYAVVSCFYRLRMPIRDQTLASIVGLPLADLHAGVRAGAEGVVRYDCIDDVRGEYAARTRHHVIAEIVWERCVEAAEREEIVLRGLEALNLNYFLDRRAFDAFVRSDRTIDSIAGFDAKTRFFEGARARIQTARTCCSTTHACSCERRRQTLH